MRACLVIVFMLSYYRVASGAFVRSIYHPQSATSYSIISKGRPILSLRTLMATSSSESDTSQETIDRQDEMGEDSPQEESRPGKKKGKLRAIRQHVNPLSRLYQQAVELPEGWVQQAFTKPSQPFHIDVGSARGRYCIDMALQYPEINFLGLEIRRPCVEEAFKKKEKAGAGGNCHFLVLNVNVDLDRVVRDIQEHSEIIRYSIQFPDPHFKKKHKKRRMVQPELVASICQSLKAEGGEILIKSDVEEVAISMREAFAQNDVVVDSCPAEAWMAENLLGVPTEREKLTFGRGDPVYRTVFVKQASAPPSSKA